MSEHLRAYQKTHTSKKLPLAWIRDYERENVISDEDDLSALAEQLQMPPASIRAALSFYKNLNEIKDSVRICRGTSCALAAGPDREVDIGDVANCSDAYCLGYCDRSPVALTPDGRIVVRGGSDEPQDDSQQKNPSPPDIRSATTPSIVTHRIGRGDYSSLSDAVEAEAYEALRIALQLSPDNVTSVLEASGERGRGGAAFPTGAKWRACADVSGSKKYVVANGDEGDPGSFVDRVLMEMDPHAILEGMALCGYAVGADEGIVFIRSEYPAAVRAMQQAIDEALHSGYLGESILGSKFDFRVSVFTALGSYVCGEETAVLNAIEGFRGEVNLRPPYPTESGLYGYPTVVDNVETLVNVPWIVRNGADAYRTLGTDACSGTKAFCLNHGFARPGIVEVEFGTSLRTIIEDCGGGGRDNSNIQAVIMGGPMGSIVFSDSWDVPVCYESMGDMNMQLGHAGLVALPDPVDWKSLLVHWLTFMQDESCGKCVPCRIGSQRALEAATGDFDEHRCDTLAQLFDVMADGSLCAFGKLLPGPMRTIIDQIGDES